MKTTIAREVFTILHAIANNNIDSQEEIKYQYLK